MVTLNITEVDGVRCFWVETGRPTLAAQLMFRQGIVDEPLPESGWLHLIEHLALRGRGGGALHVNGSVSMLVTSFEAHGPVDAVAEHLTALSSWLAAPDLVHLQQERGVLEAESRQCGSIAARALGWRYGAAGPGVCSHDEPGLARATVDALSDRARSAFTRDNSVLVLDGAPPAGLRLPLLSGEWMAPPSAVPCEDTLPAAYVENGGLVLSGVVNRSAAATFAPDLVQRALRERLREEAGAAYAPWASYEPVDEARAIVLAGSDVLPGTFPTLVDQVMGVVAELREHPVREPWLAELIEAREQAVRDPYAAAGLAWRAAHMVMSGETPQSYEEVLHELVNTDRAEVSAAVNDFCESLLLGVPGPVTWSDQLPMLRHPEHPSRSEGKKRRHRNWPAEPGWLRVDRNGLEIGVEDVARSVAFEDVAGVYAFSDGARHLVRHDGWGLTVEPAQWHGGDDAVRVIDGAVPSELLSPTPATDKPAFVRKRWLQRWWLGWRRSLRTDLALGLWAGFLVILAVVVMAMAPSTSPIVGAGLGAGLYSAWREHRARRDSHGRA